MPITCGSQVIEGSWSGGGGGGTVTLTGDTSGSGTGTIATTTTNLTIASQATGDLLARGASAWQRLAIGANGQVLTVTAGVPAWAAAVGFTNPMTDPGDLISGGVSGVATRLAIGASDYVLTVKSGVPAWASAVGFANPMNAVGDTIYGGASGVATRLAAGTNGYVLTAGGAGVAPAWAAPVGFANPMTTAGDLIAGGSSGAASRLAIGANGTFLASNGTTASWAAGLSNPMNAVGDTIYGGTSGAPTRLAVGSTGQVLTIAAGVPSWATPFSNPMNAAGDLIIGGVSGAAGRLAIGTAGQVLTVAGGTAAWATFSALVNPMNSVGDTIYGGTAGAPTRLAVGSTGQVLTIAGGVPSWATPFTNPMNSAGDLILGGVSGAAGRLAIGTAGQVLTVAGGTAAWAAATSAPTGAAGGDLGGTYPNPTVTDLTIASEAQYDLLTRGASAWQRLAIGTAGQVLTVVTGAPAWATFTALVNPMTTAGDVIIGGASGTPARLAIGTAGQVLTVSGGVPAWTAGTPGPSGMLPVQLTGFTDAGRMARGPSTPVDAAFGSGWTQVIVGKLNSSTAAPRTIWGFQTSTTAGWAIRIDGQTLKMLGVAMNINGAGAGVLASLGVTISTGALFCVAIEITATHVRVSLNGAAVVATAYTGTLTAATTGSTMGIGGDPSATGTLGFIEGSLGECLSMQIASGDTRLQSLASSGSSTGTVYDTLSSGERAASKFLWRGSRGNYLDVGTGFMNYNTTLNAFFAA